MTLKDQVENLFYDSGWKPWGYQVGEYQIRVHDSAVQDAIKLLTQHGIEFKVLGGLTLPQRTRV